MGEQVVSINSQAIFCDIKPKPSSQTLLLYYNSSYQDMAPLAQLFIDGKFVPSSNGETFEVRNPYSGNIVGLAASATSADCKAAIEAASKAFKTWEHVPVEEKLAIIAKATELLASDKYRAKILQGNQEETASVAYWAMVDWFGALSILKDETQVAEHLKKTVYPSSVPGAEVIVQRRAMGVMSVLYVVLIVFHI